MAFKRRSILEELQRFAVVEELGPLPTLVKKNQRAIAMEKMELESVRV